MRRVRFTSLPDECFRYGYAGFAPRWRGRYERHYPHAFYAGHLERSDFLAQFLWLREHATGDIVHNYLPWRLRRHSGDCDYPWHTVFAFSDANSALAYKMRWGHPAISAGPDAL